jgi:hypothetical protein
MIENEAMNETELTAFNLKQELADIDASIEEQRNIAAFAEAILELEAHPAYKLVVEDGYLTKEAERLTEILVEPNPLKRDVIENIIEMTSAIRHFKTFLKFKKLDASNVENTIEQLNDLRARVTAGEN